MTTVYLGGPMRGHDRFNFPAFDDAARRLRAHGYDVRSPAEHDRETGFDETLNSLDGFDLAAAMAWDLATIEHVDAVVFLPGFEQSSGCRQELWHADRHGKPVYQYDALDDDPFGRDGLTFALSLVNFDYLKATIAE